jgi:predicted nucleotidyltransferase
VQRIGLFGSYATGRQTREIDIDFVVEFGQPTYDNFTGLSRALSKLFGRKVDVITPDGLDGIRVRGIAESIRKALAYA